MGLFGSTPKNCSRREERAVHFPFRPADDYRRLFTDGKISLGVPPRPLISPNKLSP